jgi:hypothetical protein
MYKIKIHKFHLSKPIHTKHTHKSFASCIYEVHTSIFKKGTKTKPSIPIRLIVWRDAALGGGGVEVEVEGVISPSPEGGDGGDKEDGASAGGGDGEGAEPVLLLRFAKTTM